MRRSHWLVGALIVSSLSSAAWAEPRGGWDGTWSGAWGGQRPTSITIMHGRVVSYEFGGVSTPVSRSKVTATFVTYGDNGTVVTLTRKGETVAFATLHSSMGDATAQLRKQ
jgi:hypothetical protein